MAAGEKFDVLALPRRWPRYTVMPRTCRVALHSFELALAHVHRQAAALGGFGTGIGGTHFFGVGQGAIDEVFEERAAVAETAVSGTHALGMLVRSLSGAAGAGAAGRVDFMARL